MLYHATSNIVLGVSTDMLVMTGIGRVIAILSIEASCLMDVTGKLYGELCTLVELCFNSDSDLLTPALVDLICIVLRLAKLPKLVSNRSCC